MPLDLNARITNKYVGTYQHLDSWETIGSYEVIARGEIKRDDEYDDGCDNTTQILIIEVQSEFPDTDADSSIHLTTIKRALEASYTQWGCAHEYDCCGCRSYSGTAEHIGGNTWKVTQTSSRNY